MIVLLSEGHRSLFFEKWCWTHPRLPTFYYTSLKYFGGGVLFGVVRPSEAFPSVTLFCSDVYLGNGLHLFLLSTIPSIQMDFQIVLSPAEDSEGGYCFGVVGPSFLFPSIRPAMDYGKLTKGALWSHLPPTTDQVRKLFLCFDISFAQMAAKRTFGPYNQLNCWYYVRDLRLFAETSELWQMSIRRKAALYI